MPRNFVLTACEFKTALRISFGHASAVRNESLCALVVAAPTANHSASSHVGLGESAPREYVTGETVGSFFSFFEKHKQDLEENISSVSDLETWAIRNRREIDNNPAAFAGIEGAIIDYLAKSHGQSLEVFLGLPELRDRVQYSAILGDSRPWKFWLQTLIYVLAGFRDYKVKLSGDLKRDQRKFALLNFLSNRFKFRIRADANNLWNEPDTCISFIKELGVDFWALEEPVGVAQTAHQKMIADQLGVKIILDESLVLIDQINFIKDHEDQFIINVRISKNGGILRSIQIAQKATNMKIPLIFGAHVGETSILTRYAVAVSNAFSENVSSREGCFGRFLLKRDAVAPSLRFGFGGMFKTGMLKDTAESGSNLRLD